MPAIWAAVLIAGVVGAALGSRRAVADALVVADGLGISPGVVGLSVLAVGTDLPEIANSISASITGHGDLVVGDATGSAVTQITLVLAILILAMPSIATPGDGSAEQTGSAELVAPVGAVTVAALALIAWLVSDDRLDRLDGAFLVGVWIVTMTMTARREGLDGGDGEGEQATGAGTGRHLATLVAWLLVVAVSATLVISSFVELTDWLGVPELLASTFVLAIGTSLPELVVDWTAIRAGAVALAFGDLFGSSLVDSSLSIGIGPLINPTSVSSEAAPSVLVVALSVAVATILVWFGRNAGRRLATALLLVYVGCYGTLVALST